MSAKWKAEFAAALGQLRNEDYVRAGVVSLEGALNRLANDSFVDSQIDALVRSGDEAAVEVVRAGRIPLGRARSVGVDSAWSLNDVEDRNDRWLIQQWCFVRECVYEAIREKRTTALVAWLPRLEQWCEANLSVPALERPKELNWHDHATALRALNLIWLARLVHEFSLTERRNLTLLFELVEIHTVVLMSEGFYSVGTNHGFDQAYALYFLSSAFPLGARQREAVVIARQRLIFELRQAFNEEGVHIENSPGYHSSMFGRLFKAKALLEAFDGPGQVDIDATAEKAIAFLTHALKGDRTLPLLGDTEAVPLRLDLGGLKQFAAFPNLLYAYSAGKEGREPESLTAVYPKAGYAFLRDRWPSADAPHCTHLSFKCGFLSSYHRHDDDNTIVLSAFGEEWLVGSGIYRYHEQDELRKYLRSASAQNILSVDGVTPDRSARQSSIVDVSAQGDAVTLVGRSGMFPGFTYQRTVTFDRAREQITLVDVIEPTDLDWHDYTLRFHAPHDREIRVLSADGVRMRSPQSGRSLTIEFRSAAKRSIDVVSGQAEPPLGWTSPQRGTVEAAHTICIRAGGVGRFELASTLSFRSVEKPRSCSICDSDIARRVAQGQLEPVERASPVFIDGALADARCPACGSRARHRALAALLQRAAPALQSNAEVLLISASKPERAICSKHFARWRHVSLIGSHDDPSCELGVDITSFDSEARYHYILAWVVFDYIPEAERALHALARALVPGGSLMFYIMPYRISCDVAGAEVVHRNALKDESYAPTGPTTGIPHCRFNPDALLRWMTESGLVASIVQIRDDSSPMLLDVFVGRKPH